MTENGMIDYAHKEINDSMKNQDSGLSPPSLRYEISIVFQPFEYGLFRGDPHRMRSLPKAIKNQARCLGSAVVVVELGLALTAEIAGVERYAI